jgi:hypothetical protein
MSDTRLEGHCATCRFASVTDADKETPDLLRYWCKRYPPRPDFDNPNEPLSPLMMGHDWCGEWQPDKAWQADGE